MPNALRHLAKAANILFFIGILVLMQENRPYGIEYLYFFLLLAFPVLNLFLLCTGPDREERELRRKVNKAELRNRLKELGEN